MFIPVLTPLSQRLYPRRGGGGKGGGGKGSTSSSESSGSSGGSRGSQSSVPVSGATVGRSTALAYGGGGGRTVTIPQGQLFAGRTSGGGTRDQVYGSRSYGSGYPGLANNRGVGGLGFPFVFWPIVWGGGLGYGAAYLHDREYGDPNNSSRPGGPMTQAAFVSNATSSTFHVLADNTTVASLINSVSANCSYNIGASSSTPASYNSSDPKQPQPEEAVQYFRASSVALTLDGYNDTSVLGNDTNATNVPLPSGIDATLLECLNSTIGQAAPLIESAELGRQIPSLGWVGLLWVMWCMSSLI